MADYYKALGLFPEATQDQVWRAIRRYELRRRWKDAPHQVLIERAIRVLSDATLRAAYDRVQGFNQDIELQQRFWAQARQLEQCQQQQAQLETELRWLRTQRLEVSILQQELIQCRQQKERLEVAQQRWAESLPTPAKAIVTEEQAATQRRKWRLYAYLVAAVLALALPGLVRSVFNEGPSVDELFGSPYEPVAVGVRWGVSPDSAVQKQVEIMPQFRGGAAGLRNHIEDQVLTQLPLAKAKALLATGQLSIVVDSAGHIGPVRVLNVADSASRQLLLAIGRRLPRFIPGFQEARPANVRLTVKLAR
jgi:hypothetical protein